jgi:hypothetical protein
LVDWAFGSLIALNSRFWLDTASSGDTSPFVIARIVALPDYAGMFDAAFGTGPSIERVGQAMANWERSLLAARASAAARQRSPSSR